MSKNIAKQDLKTLAIVLRRTNYGEADRILNLITPEGKISAIAKGVRRAKSKLAGGVEMFTLSELQIHLGRSEMGVVTSAKMRKYFGRILQDFERMELAGTILKQVSKAAEHTDSPEWFSITEQALTELDNGINAKLIESWFGLNLLRISGEEMNLYRDSLGEKLKKEKRYDWSVGDAAFIPNERGIYGADEIKLLRLMTTTNLGVIKRVKVTEELQKKVSDLVRIGIKK